MNEQSVKAIDPDRSDPARGVVHRDADETFAKRESGNGNDDARDRMQFFSCYQFVIFRGFVCRSHVFVCVFRDVPVVNDVPS